jgi:hypothetical protein
MNNISTKLASKSFNLPKLGTDTTQNRDDLVAFYVKHSPFMKKQDWNWTDSTWDVKGICQASPAKMQNRQLLHFTRYNGLSANVKSANGEMKPFHSLDLSNVAKCHVCAKQIAKSKNSGTLQQKINAYRYLDMAISKSRKSVEAISTKDFQSAELLARKKLADSTFYKLSGALEEIQQYFIRSKLLAHKPTFRKTAQRSQLNLISDTRIDQESINNRNEKLPTLTALLSVGKLSNQKLTGRDALLQSLTDILFTTGLRFGEVVTLDVNCLKIYRTEAFCDITGRSYRRKVFEISYKPEKGGAALTKEVCSKSLAKILIRAINRIRKLLADTRSEILQAKRLNHDFFPSLPDHGQVFIPKATELMNWSSRSNLITFLEKHLNLKLELKRNAKTGKKSKIIDTHFLKRAAKNTAFTRINELSKLLEDTSLASSPEELLFVQKHQENHSVKTTNPFKYQLFTETEYQDFLCGRKGYNIKSVFERILGDEISPEDTLTSHKFRHFLNTMAQLSDSISEIEIARYFGRKYQGDNETYDHTNPVKRVFDHAEDIINSNPLVAERQKEAFVMFALVEREEVLNTIENLSTTMVTSIGLCRHDFSESPCGKHYACLRGCAEYQRIKGDKIEIREITEILEQHEKHVVEAKNSVDSGYHGSNQWLQSHMALIDGCKKALEIENDERIQLDERVTIFPNGNTKCEVE